MDSLEGSSSDTAELCLPAKKWPQLSSMSLAYWGLLSKGQAEVLTMRMRRDHDGSNIKLWTVLYDEYKTGGAFDSPMQSTVMWIETAPPLRALIEI